MADCIHKCVKHEGSFFVLLSLVEAEHFRSVLHSKGNFPLLQSDGSSLTHALLWVINGSKPFEIASSFNAVSSSRPQRAVMACSYQFYDSRISFSEAALSMLLRTFLAVPCDRREKWWVDSRACRRRSQLPSYRACPVRVIFEEDSEYPYLEYRAVVFRIQVGLKNKKMFTLDFFRAMNMSGTGFVTCSELFGGLDYLGIPIDADGVYSLMRKMSTQQEVIFSCFCFVFVYSLL